MNIPEGYYAILFRESESDTIGVRFQENPGVITYGSDWEEAGKMAREALSAALEAEFDRGASLPEYAGKPEPNKDERIVFIRIAPEIRTAYLLRSWREQSDLTQKDIAEKLGITYQAYQRMERPGRSNLTVATLDKIAEVLGRKLVISIK